MAVTQFIPNPMPCISLWQPWAQWIALGWKTIETRTHARFAGLEGRRIGIHAAAKWDKQAIDAARPYLTAAQLAETEVIGDATGLILRTAHVGSHALCSPHFDAPKALIECDTERWGLRLIEIQMVPKHAPIAGGQGIFYVERTADGFQRVKKAVAS